jgi:hypothetical protein
MLLRDFCAGTFAGSHEVQIAGDGMDNQGNISVGTGGGMRAQQPIRSTGAVRPSSLPVATRMGFSL